MSDKDFPTTSSIIARMKKRNHSDPNAAFPTMLHRMLSDIEELSKTEPEMAKLKSIISWQEHGRAFKLHDKKKFIAIIMPAFFVRLKYTSFIRQLNTYNFKRISEEGEDKGALYHENFIREMPELTSKIPKMKKRKSNAGTGSGSEGSASLPRTVSTDMSMPQQQQQQQLQNEMPSLQMQQKALSKAAPRVNTLKNLIMEQNMMRQQQQKQQAQNHMSMMSQGGVLNTGALFNQNNMMNGMGQSMAPMGGMGAPMCNTGFPQIMMDATTPMYTPPQTFMNNNNNNGWVGHHDLSTNNGITTTSAGVVEDNGNSLQRLLEMAEVSGSPFDFSIPVGDEDDHFEPVPISPLLDNQRNDMNALFTSEIAFGGEF